MATSASQHTETETTRELSTAYSSVARLRATKIHARVTNMRPNCRINCFVNGIALDTGHANAGFRQIEPLYINTGGIPLNATGSNLRTDWPLTSFTGSCDTILSLGDQQFPTGDLKVIITDAPTLAALEIPGNTYGHAEAIFSSSGTLSELITTYQQTDTLVTTTINERILVRGDPLAQSFFTHNMKGGIFVTSIDLYFQAKPSEAAIPVKVEIRPMVNGFPSDYATANPAFIITKNPIDVAVSNNASAKTNFKFANPVHLPENGDYCFVVSSQSNKYTIWTSRLGEKSIETGNIIFEQPYIGSLFKSENNYTWTAEQYEDIKFTLNKAVFATNTTRSVEFQTTAAPVGFSGKNFTTISGSNKIIFKSPRMHGLSLSSKLLLSAQPPEGVAQNYERFNGLTIANLNSDYTGFLTITRIIDDYTIEFQARANATSTGPILSSGTVNKINVISGGTGYPVNSTINVTMSAPSSGTTASAIAYVNESGSIYKIYISSRGQGYTSPPLVTIIGSTGSGAIASASLDVVFTLTLNKPVSTLSPQIKYSVIDGTSVSAELRSLSSNLVSSTSNFSLDKINKLNTDSIILNYAEQNTLSTPATRIMLSLRSSNPNVSPVVDIASQVSLFAYNNSINTTSQYESETATTEFAGVATVVVSNGGSGYMTQPSITFTPAEFDTNKANIVAATATAVLNAGVITEINVTSGSGYTLPPTVTIAGVGTGAAAYATITKYNSELGNSGTAYSRYLTKKIKLQTVSTDIRLFAIIYSTTATDVDWYIRTSISSDASIHEDNLWRILSCDTDRNKSTSANEFFEYEFYTPDSIEFDTYDLKCVLKSSNKILTPYVKNYRVIAVS